MLEPGGEGRIIHYQQLLGSIRPRQIRHRMDSRGKEHMALKARIMSHIQSVGHTRHVSLETRQAWKRETQSLIHMLSLTGDPRDLSGKPQGENTAV